MAALASAMPLAALAQSNLSLDTGTTGGAGTGDVTFTGSSIAAVGSATLSQVGDVGPTVFSLEYNAGSFSEMLLAAAQGGYSTAPVTGINFIVNDVIAVHTNGGNYAAMLVTALSGSSITLQYITYNTSGTQIQSGTVTLGGQSGPTPPTVTEVQNNYSFIVPGAPNYGIAPGTLVLVSGSGMATPGSSASPLQDGTKGPLPQTLNGATVTVTVNGQTVHPAFYYAIPSYLGVVIPSSTPVGTGTITVTYNNLTSTPLPITIVPHAFGFDYYGGALAAITDNGDGHLITTTNPARPGEQIVFWGAGDGADTNNDDISPPKHFDNLTGITALYIGGIQVPIEYQGRSTYQGVDQINVQVPTNAPTGCAVSVEAVSGTGSNVLVSNFVAMPIGTAAGQCTDTLSFVDPTLAATLAGKTSVKFGGVSISQSTYNSQTSDAAGGTFYTISGNLLAGYTSSSQPSLGSCFVTQSNTSTATNPFSLSGLDAGSLSVTGPNGTEPLSALPSFLGLYEAQLPAGFIPASGGTFTFKGTGGADVGPFTTGVSLPNPLTWTNAGSDGTITRSNGVTVTWTGGSSGTFVEITGYSSAAGFSSSFLCTAPVSAGTFTVPAPVLLAMPAGSGNLDLSNYANYQTFTATGLDFGFSSGYVSDSINAVYQ
jgi:uncharacterized protein (TIGR03437 family)